MDSLISRQAAIDALCSECQGRCIPCKYYPCSEVKAINALPSAQPEIVRCKDCKYGEQDEVGRWFCSDLGCQIGSEDGSGFCADAERRTE